MTNISKKLACTLTVGLWSMASMALAGQGHAAATGCFEGGAQGKPVMAAKTQEDCQKLGEKFLWKDAKAEAGKSKGKVKQQAKSEAKAEVKPAATTIEAVPAVPTEAPAK